MWDLQTIDVDKPLYLAIADAIERDVRAGELLPGERMPTHRELSKIVGVTVTTVTRAYREAERRGLVTAIVGNGTFVTSDRGSAAPPSRAGSAARECIELGMALPPYGIEANLREVLDGVMRKTDLQALMKYIEPEGLPRHRQTGAAWIRRFGIDADPDNIVVTAGANNALACLFMSVFEPGDRLAIDFLTYPGAKSLARRCGIRLEGVAMDGEGMLPDALEALCRRHAIRGVHTVGRLHNPTNAAMSERRRREIADVIVKNDLLLIEDDIYGFLSDEAGGALTPHVPENGLYIAGLAKAFCAGLRVGFVVVPPRYRSAFSLAVADTMWMASPLCVEAACEVITSGVADGIVLERKKEIAARAALAGEILSGHHYTHADNSMFLWLELPEYWYGDAFEDAARENGVSVVSAGKFIVGSALLPNCVRLSLTATDTVADLEKGLGILLRLLESKRGGGVRIL